MRPVSSPSSPLPLPEGWRVVERVDDVISADGLFIRRVGLCATSGDQQAVGSAADVEEEDPTSRATFELLERIALADAMQDPARTFPVRSASGAKQGVVGIGDVFPASGAPEAWVFARSSGVSLHKDWEQACASATRELVERDRILRAWLGETRPLEIGDPAGSRILAKAASYDWRTVLFPAPESPSIACEVQVVGVYGFPREKGVPLVFGFGARADRKEAARSARREALQLMSFLWGEAIPEEPPEPAPTPLTHLETYQVRDRHEILRHWLAEGHEALRRDRPACTDVSFQFVDLTPPWLRGQFTVAKALCPALIPLTFGRSPLLAHLPSHLKLHPIP